MALETIHGGVVAISGSGCLILGKSGSGKSRLMAEMMAFGARLVADDRVELIEQSGMLMGEAPKELSGIMELRGAGLIRVIDIIPRHVIHLVVELTESELERVPEPATMQLAGRAIPLLKIDAHASAAVIIQYMKAMQENRILPPDWRPGV